MPAENPYELRRTLLGPNNFDTADYESRARGKLKSMFAVKIMGKFTPQDGEF